MSEYKCANVNVPIGSLQRMIFLLYSSLWLCRLPIFWLQVPQMTSAPPEKMCWLFSLLFLASFIPLVKGLDGGLKVQVTQKGLEYAKNFGLEMLKASLKKEQMKDVRGSYDVPLLGVVDYSVSGIQVKQLEVDHSTVGFLEGTGLNLTIQNAQIALNSQWTLSAWFGGEDGTVDVHMDLLFLSLLLGVDKDGGGRPRVSYASCHSAVGDLQLKFYKGNSWLYNLLAAALKGTLRAEVNKHGEFFTARGPPESPFLPAPFHLPNRPDSMVRLGISEFFANSAALAYFMAGALRVNYTNQTIPKNIPFRLNTKNLGVFIPELKKEFPDMGMEIHITAQKPPVLSFHPGSLEAAVLGSLEAFVVRPNASLASAFLLNIVTYLEPFLKIAGQMALFSTNRHLKKGFALPGANGLSLLDPKVTMDQGYLLIATDLCKEPEGKRGRRGIFAASPSPQRWRRAFLWE
ncbi:hypothetical protein JRQ81_014423 [Phrynocephalus forsythii]|uniref:Bactericidal permeability-increasing protein n=1 Tax=Phrynocephalus forsythii TaxID=171643 RepID=A0A9Q0XZA8_9SAUR|nr:hypothetical protein JRQ81_014423 [Phrynocephalus forsythii]